MTLAAIVNELKWLIRIKCTPCACHGETTFRCLISKRFETSAFAAKWFVFFTEYTEWQASWGAFVAVRRHGSWRPFVAARPFVVLVTMNGRVCKCLVGVSAAIYKVFMF